MAQESQEGFFDESGRVNQKRRTRKAIVAAAQAMLERGDEPTVATAAEEALVSRTTAYRYFPTQESLMVELSVSLSVAEIDEVLSAQSENSSPLDRLLQLVEVYNRYLATNEVLSRTAQRHYLDTWLAAERAGTGHDQVRRGRRREWIAMALGPVRQRLDDVDFERLQAALCLTLGSEAFLVLRDVCELDSEEAVAVARWAAAAIFAASIQSLPAGSKKPGSMQDRQKSDIPPR